MCSALRLHLEIFRILTRHAFCCILNFSEKSRNVVKSKLNNKNNTSKKSYFWWIQGGAEELKLNKLISNGLISHNEKANAAWLVLKDDFPSMDQDKFLRELLRCKKLHAMSGNSFVGWVKICLALITGAHVAAEADNENEDLVVSPSVTVTLNRRTRSSK